MKLIFGIFTVLVLLLVGAVIAPSFIDWSQYKAQIEAQAEKATGYDVVLGGDLSLSIIPSPRVYIEDVTVKAPEGFDAPHLAKLERLELGVAALPLLSKNIQITYVEAISPDIHVVLDEQGELSGLTAEIEAMKEGGESADATATEAKAAPNISLDKLIITNGRVSVANNKAKTKMAIEEITLAARADSLSGPFTAKGDLVYDGKALSFDANIGDISGDDIKVVVDAGVNGGLATLRYAGLVSMAQGISAQGQLSTKISNPSALSKALDPQSASDYKDAVSLDALVNATDKAVSLDNLRISTAGNEAQGKLSVALAQEKSPMVISGDIRSLENKTGQRVLADFKMVMNGSNIDFSDTKVTFGPSTADISGRYNSKSQSLNVNAKVNRFNSADFTKGSNAPAGSVHGSDAAASNASQAQSLKKDIQKSVSSLSIPVNVTADIEVTQGVVGDLAFKGLQLSGGAKTNGGVSISRLSVQDIGGAQIIAQGNVANLKALSGIDMNVSVDTKDVVAFASRLKVDVSALPKTLKALNATLKAKGDLESMTLGVTAKALGGEITVNGAVKDPLANMVADKLALRVKHASLTRAIQIQNPAFKAPMPAFNKPLDFAANIALGKNEIDLSAIKSTLLGSNMSGALSIKTGGARPDLSGALTFSALDLGGAAAKKGASGSSSGSKTFSGSRWSSDQIDASFLNAADFDLAIKAASLKHAGWDLKSPVFNAKLNNGLLTLSEVSAGLYDGRLSTSATVQAQGKSFLIKAKPSIQNVSLQPLVTSLVKSDLIKGKGRVSMNADLNMAGGSQAALVKSLGGSGTVAGQSIVIDGVDLTRFARAMSDDVKIGDSLSSLWGGARSGGSTAFETLDGAFDITAGVINMSKMDLTGAQADIATTGAVNVPKWTLATKHTITLKEGDVPPFSMEFKGSLDNPAQTFGQGALQDYLQRKLQRKIQKELQGGAIGQKLQKEIGDKIGIPNLFGGGSTQATPPAANDNQPEADRVAPSNNEIQRVEPEELIRGVLGGFLGR